MSVIVALAVDEMLEASKQVGTASNQYLLGGLVIVLIAVVVYRERQQQRNHAASMQQHAEAKSKAEEAISHAQQKHDDAVVAAQAKYDEIQREASKERRELYERMEKQTELMNVERSQRWTMLIDVVRENTQVFRGVRETLDQLRTFMADSERERKELLRGMK